MIQSALTDYESNGVKCSICGCSFVSDRGVSVHKGRVHNGQEKPWADRSILERLYVNEGMNSEEIGSRFGCTGGTICKWLDRHGIERRGAKAKAATDASVESRQLQPPRVYTDHLGYEVCKSTWEGETEVLLIHRLIALLDHSLTELDGRDVHHKNTIPWDNRPENLELVTKREHRQRHRKVGWMDQIRIGEMYEHGDISSRRLGAIFNVANPTVLSIHSDLYGD